MQEINQQSVTLWMRDEDMVFRRLGEELVLVPIRRGLGDFNSFYVLNDVAAFLWGQLATAVAETKLIEDVMAAYDVERNEAESDVRSYLGQLREMGAVKNSENINNGEARVA